jgi:phenylpropionate dioxygenase-like ring-hydroxylating dioxygenase large terminal subunit
VNRRTQRVQIRQLLDHVDARSTDLAEAPYANPVGDYTCPEQLARERQALFRDTPLVLALGCDLPRPGDWLAHDLAGVPVLLARNEGGQVNAFLNVCRHRGSRVASERGSGRRVFTCPYHAWSYDLDGRLVGVPSGECFGSPQRDGIGLVRLPVAERHGFLWTRLTPGEAVDADAHLGRLATELQSYGFDRYHHYATRRLERRMNWKLVVDTFLETYHVPVLHRDSIAPIFFGNVATFESFGLHLRMVAARRTLVELRGRAEEAWDLIPHSAIVYVVFPNLVLIMQGDHVETWRVYPGATADESVMELSLYTPEPAATDKARRYWDKNVDLTLRTVEGEDFPLAEGMQRGFHSGAQPAVTYGRNEPALAHFHQAVRRALGLPSLTP